MNIHSPKLIKSNMGLGLPTNKKTSKKISDEILITEELWQEMTEPWKQGETVIAKPGFRWITKWQKDKNFIITKILDNKDNLVGYYCDISSPIKEINGDFEFFDWYLDVWQRGNEKLEVLDVDELEQALLLNYLTKEQADIANKAVQEVINLLNNPNLESELEV